MLSSKSPYIGMAMANIAVLEAATPGPWRVDGDHVRGPDAVSTVIGNHAPDHVATDVRMLMPEKVARDVEAIVLSRNLLPDALAVVRAAEALDLVALWHTPEAGALVRALSAFTERVQSALGEEES